mmetsp:Transcript_45902/g.98105  ORF Transcript_45902/g.98105 Transcript_45902/m.98105 type:complete len:202 (+) Transcript_45902:1122-1727(+)
MLHGGGLDLAHVRTGRRLGNREADNLLARRHVGHHSLLHIRCSPLHNRRQADRQAAGNPPEDAARTASRKLINQDQLVEIVRLEAQGALADQLLRPRSSAEHRQQSSLPDLADQLHRDFLLLVQVMAISHDLILHKVAHDLPQLLVGVVVIPRVVERVVPHGVTERVGISEHIGVHTLEVDLGHIHGQRIGLGRRNVPTLP